MSFEKRDIILIVGILFFMIGLLGVGLNLVEAVGISIAIYFGIKIFVGRRKKFLDQKIGEGFCAECGEKIIAKKCPNCDMPKK
ncbi:MAG: hypothetical protein ACHQ1D_07465 [Nitrososphaerales archaeon]